MQSTRAPRVLFYAAAFALVLQIAGLTGLWAGTVRAEARTQYSVYVPILMYHYIRVNPFARDRAGADLSVSPEHFAQQMALLAAEGFHTVTLDDLMAAIFNGTRLPSMPIILTFDDGYEDFYTAALPVLEKYSFRATSFIITGKVGRGNYMTWQQIKQIEAGGLVQFESHTVDHADMGHMSIARAHNEMLASKVTLERQLGVPVDYFCYPAGHYTAGEISMLGTVGYVAGVGTRYATVHSLADLGALTRVRIHGGDSLASFAAKLGIKK